MEKSFKLSLSEIFLLQLILWTALWLINDFVAVLLTLSIGAVVLVVLLLALISEMIERSKVPRKYFYVMGLTLLAMTLSTAVYVYIFGGQFTFLGTN